MSDEPAKTYAKTYKVGVVCKNCCYVMHVDIPWAKKFMETRYTCEYCGCGFTARECFHP